MVKEKEKPLSGLAIGLPTRGLPVAFEWAACMHLMRFPTNVERFVFPVKYRPVDEARNRIVWIARQQRCKYLLMIDDDTAPPFFAPQRLMYDLGIADDDVMIAGGIYFTKDTPSEPIVYQGNGSGPFWKWKKGEVFEVTGMGTGCMLIKMELFDKLPVPETRTVEIRGQQVELPWWFKTTSSTPQAEEQIHVDGNGSVHLGFDQSDDLYFCDQVVKAGYKMIADGGVICVHWDMSVSPPKAYGPTEAWSIKEEIS